MVVELGRRSIPVFRWHPEDFPMRASISCSLAAERRPIGRLDVSGKSVQFEDIRSVWFRKPMPHVLPSGLDASEAEFAGREVRQAYQGVIRTLDCLWINHPDANSIAGNKPVQLKVATELGLRVPKTLITNDPAEVRAFRAGLQGEMVYKPVTWGMISKSNIGWGSGCMTSVIADEHLQHLDLVRNAPCIFQERIEKRLELRITIVGETVFPVAIFSQEHADGQVRQDWRSAEPSSLRHEPFELPREVRDKLLRMMAQFHLTYGAVDMIVTPSGEYVFLEINPGGQFGWLEDITGLPITPTIADLLIAGRNSSSSPGAA